MTTSLAKPRYESRRFMLGWAQRREGVLKVASRIMSMARLLNEVEPGLGALWPQFEARRLRPSDPGPILDMSEGDLALLIDRRGRADPPAYPVPVGPSGYHFAIVGQPGLACELGLWVENFEFSEYGVPIQLSLPNENPIWKDAGKSRRLLYALVDAWDAQWASATAFVVLGSDPDGASISEERPWMCWARSGHKAPDVMTRAGGPPQSVRAEHGGEFCLWPWAA